MPVFACFPHNPLVADELAIEQKIVPGGEYRGEDFCLPRGHWPHQFKHPFDIYKKLSEHQFGARDQFVEFRVLRYAIACIIHALEEEVARHPGPMFHLLKVRKVVRACLIFERHPAEINARSEERRLGKEWVSPCRY